MATTGLPQAQTAPLSTGNAGTTTSYVQPQYYTDTAAGVAGGIQDMLGTNGYLNSALQNLQTGNPTQGALSQLAQFDPAKQQQFFNPYTTNVIDANNQQSNQNLMENILPGVNSTFTGAGQFGSTRNADFANRAIRDNQQTLNNTNANVLMNAQNQAASQYKDWTGMQGNAGQADYTNALSTANFPVGALSQLGQTTGNIRPGNPSSVSTEAAGLTDIEKWVTALGVANTGANDGTIQGILSMLGNLFSGSSSTTSNNTDTPLIP